MKTTPTHLVLPFLFASLPLAGTALAAAPADETPGGSATVPGTTLNEIIVTAQRREQKAADVGIAITAYGAQDLDDLNIVNASDLVRAVPSLKMNAFSAAAVVWNIRGVSQNDYGDQQEPPVAVYQDDSYSSSINTSSFPIFDLARTEVLRGPQGTLFGRNATGGAIQFISNMPTKELDGYATATFGSFQQRLYEGAISGPLTGNVQDRFAFIKEDSNGYIRNVTPGAPDFFGARHYALRNILAWQPGEKTNVRLTLRYMRAPNERAAGGYDFQPACPNAQLQGAILGPNDSCAYWGSPPGAAANGYRNDAITPSRGGDPWTTAAGDAARDDRRIFGSSLRVDSTFDHLTFTSITDYQRSEKYYLEDDDSSPPVSVQFFENNQLSQVSQEFRATMEAEKHEFVAGLFGMHITGDYYAGFPIHFIGYEPRVTFREDTMSFAVFAQDEWSFADKLKLITGLRYWRDERIGSYYGHAPPIPAIGQPDVLIIFNTSQIYPAGSNITPSDADKIFNGITARLALEYKPTTDMLLYASYNRGSKSGGFTFSSGTPFDPNEVPFLNSIPYKPEVLTAYETGVKATISNRTTINASAFYYDYKDYQAFAQVGLVQAILNLNAKAEGLELDLESRPLNGLTLRLGTSLMSTRVEHILLPDFATYVDHDLPQTPHFSGNAMARYEFGVGGGTGSIQADVLYSGRFCFTVLCAPVEQEPPYAVGNARAGFTSSGGRWEFAAFCNNVANRAYRQYAFDDSQFAGNGLGIYAKPRTYGVTVNYRLRKG
jgi:iron complex outermembrane receptor protein